MANKISCEAAWKSCYLKQWKNECSWAEEPAEEHKIEIDEIEQAQRIIHFLQGWITMEEARMEMENDC